MQLQNQNEPRGNGSPRMSPAEYFAEKEAAEKRERSDLFRDASLLAILLLSFNLLKKLCVRVFWVLAGTVCLGSFSLDAYSVQNRMLEEKKELVSSTSFSMTAAVVVTFFASLGIFLIGQLLMKKRFAELFKPYKGFVCDGVKFFPTTISLNLMVSLVVTAIITAFGDSGVNIPVSDFSINDTTAYGLVIQLVYVCLVGPVCEEFIYRGLMLRLLAPYGKCMAVVFSSVAFGLMHGNLQQAIPAMAGGLVYGFIVVNSNSLAPSILIHMLNNLAASVGDYGRALGWSFTDTLIRVMYIILLFIGIYGLIVFFMELIHKVYESEPKLAMSYQKRCIACCTNIFILIYMGYLIWNIVESIAKAN